MVCHVRCNPWTTPETPLKHPQHPHMTMTNFNYENSYLPGVICNIVVTADLGRSPGRCTPTPQMHHGIYIMGCMWQPFWILQEKVEISSYFWIIRVVNSHLALYSHVRCNPLDTPETPPKHPQMTVRDLNSDRWYLPWIPVHKTWQMNLFWPMDTPRSQSRDALNTSDITLGRNLHWQWTPQYQSKNAIEYLHFGRDETLAQCYPHLTEQRCNFTLLLTSSGQEWQFHINTDIEWSRMAISHCYWHLVVKNGNFTLLLTTSGQEWQFHTATDT